MNTIGFEKKNTLVIAHRGLSGIEQENTCSSFVAAGNRSYYGIETDIHKTADGHFIISHDINLERIAGEKINVESATLSELQDIVLFDKDGTKSRNDLRLCILENYVTICKKYEKQSILELKSDFTNKEIKSIVDIFKKQDHLDKVTFISFNYDNLLRVRGLLPKQSVQYLFWSIEDEILDRLAKDKIDLDVYNANLTEQDIKRAHSLGLKVNCWTVDNKEDAERLAKWDIDYITSNILE